MRIIHRLGQHSRRGGALAASLVVVILVAGLGAGLVSMQSSLTRRHDMSVDSKRALYVAEAGVAEAFAAMSLGKSGSVGTAEIPAAWGNGVYWVEATPDVSGNVHLKSTGLVGRGRFAINVVVRPNVNPVTSNGVFGDEEVVIEEGAILDGYNSLDGRYEEPGSGSSSGSSSGTSGGSAGMMGIGGSGSSGGDSGSSSSSEESDSAKVTSNGDVIMYGSLVKVDREWQAETYVYGDVHPGPSGVVTLEPGVEVTGETTPQDSPGEMPEIVIPKVDTVLGSEALNGTLDKVSVSYDTVLVRAEDTLTIIGPSHFIVDDLIVEGKLKLDATNGPVQVIATNKMLFGASSMLETESEDPTQVGLFFTGDGFSAAAEGSGATTPDEFMIRSTGTFHGMLYAPNSYLTVPASLRVFGAVAGKRVRLEAGAKVTFDQNSTQASLGVLTSPEILSWQIVDLPDAEIVNTNMDPNIVLKQNGVTAVKSDQAHHEDRLRLNYMDSMGVLQVYEGTVNNLDFTTVDTVMMLEWNDPEDGYGEPATLKRTDYEDYDPSAAKAEWMRRMEENSSDLKLGGL